MGIKILNICITAIFKVPGKIHSTKIQKVLRDEKRDGWLKKFYTMLESLI
jgi:hypothetical protein